MSDRSFRLVLGVIGADVHIVGVRLLEYAFTSAGYEVTNLGVMVSQDEFIDAAIETNADAILVSSMYGHGEIDCRGFRERCRERGIPDIPLLVGGNLVVGRQDWAEVEAMFLEYGFDVACPPGTDIDTVLEIVDEVLSNRSERTGGAR